MSYYGWAPYVSVAQRRAKANREMDKLRKKGVQVSQVGPIAGRKIAKTFWGEGWCNHLEQFSDYENRLPRGRTYVRNGSVCHLAIAEGKIEAIVSGSELYKINIQIKTMPRDKWAYIRQSCTGRIGSLLELLQGRFSDEVMRVVTDRKDGLFPLPGTGICSGSFSGWLAQFRYGFLGIRAKPGRTGHFGRSGVRSHYRNVPGRDGLFRPENLYAGVEKMVRPTQGAPDSR